MTSCASSGTPSNICWTFRRPLLSAEDLTAIAADLDRVAQRAEQEIERDDRSSGEPLESFPAAIYTIRERDERIYRRGAS